MQKSKLTTSVAICTFNGVNYIKEQVCSIIDQTIEASEVIIVDDKSLDYTVNLAKEILNNSTIKFIIIENEKNLGFVKNFEKALSLCSNDIIFLSDQDDIWYPDKIQILLKYFNQNNKIAGITHEAKLVDEKRVWYGNFKNNQFKNGYGSARIPVTGALSAVKKDYCTIILPIPNISGHDIWIDYIFSFFEDYWLIVDDCLGEIRRHQSNTSEWIVNSLKKINKIDRFIFQMSTIPAESYEDRLIMNSELSYRLQHIENINFLFDQVSISHALMKLSDERHAIDLRINIVKNKFGLTRYYFIFKLLFSGGYKYFNGLSSLLRDMLRK